MCKFVYEMWQVITRSHVTGQIVFLYLTSFQAVLLNLGDKNYVERCLQQIYMFENLKKIMLENNAERFIETMMIMKHCIGL